MKKTIACILTAVIPCALLIGCFGLGEGVAPAPVQSSLPLPSSAQAPPSTQPQPEPEQETSSPESEAPAAFTLVVPEGYTLARIGMTLEEQGVCSNEEFIQAAQTGDYSGYSLVAAQIPNEHRCFALEGYLFPATYEFSAGATPNEILRTMLNTTEQRLAGGILERINQSGYTVDEILTLASIIQKESLDLESMGLVSSVLHNRLAVGMQLQCDVTIVYVEGAIKPFIEGDIDRYNEYYNTYKCPALPAGAICNPGMQAIEAALSPVVSDYLYFVTDAAGNYYFAATWEEHQANLVTAGLE